MPDPIIALDGIVKTYGRTTALDGLSLRVERGEIVGLLGPNGAGKTTTVKSLLGLTRVTAGTGTVLGAPLGDRGIRARIGYLPELFRYQPWLSGRDVLRLHAELASLSRARWPAAIDAALAVVGLVERAGDRVSTYSKGMQQRLGLATALLGDPELVLLDEPTSALDPQGRVEVRDIVRGARERGATVVLNSHLLTEVEQVCDRVIVLHRGRTIAAGPLDEVVGAQGIRVRVTDLPGSARSGIESLIRAMGGDGGSFDGGWLTVRGLSPERVPDLVAALVAGGGRIHAVEPAARSLETAFLALIADDPAPTTPPR